MLSILFFLLIFLKTIHCELHPVLLVPGLGGSQIVSKYLEHPKTWPCHTINESFLTWIDPILFTPFTIDCIINLLKLEYNHTSRKTYPPKYCETEVPGFGKVDTIAYVSKYKLPWTVYYNNIIKELVKNNYYTANVNIRGAPYDFRKDLNELTSYLFKVKNLIEEMYEKANQSSVVIICHSYGNIIILKLLNDMPQMWKTKYIRSFISISAPYSGAMVALQSVLSGFKSATFLVNPLRLRKLESTWPSLYYLMPFGRMWPTNSIVLTKNLNFTAHDISKMMKLSNVTHAYEHYENAINNMNQRKAPNVEVHCIISVDMLTTMVLDYRNVKFPDSKPVEQLGNGDGTVPLHSLMICPQWKTQQKPPVTLYTISKVKHLKMVKHEFTVKTIHKILCEINQNCRKN